MKQVFVAGDVTEAHLVKGLLESHGLGAEVRGEDLSGTRGEVPFADAWPTVWVVDDAHEAEARAVIAAFESRTELTESDAGWRCPACQQEIEPQFTACWARGAERR